MTTPPPSSSSPAPIPSAADRALLDLILSGIAGVDTTHAERQHEGNCLAAIAAHVALQHATLIAERDRLDTALVAMSRLHDEALAKVARLEGVAVSPEFTVGGWDKLVAERDALLAQIADNHRAATELFHAGNEKAIEVARLKTQIASQLAISELDTLALAHQVALRESGERLVGGLRTVLRIIAAYDKSSKHGPGICPYGCDCPQIAKDGLGLTAGDFPPAAAPEAPPPETTSTQSQSRDSMAKWIVALRACLNSVRIYASPNPPHVKGKRDLPALMKSIEEEAKSGLALREGDCAGLPADALPRPVVPPAAARHGE